MDKKLQRIQTKIESVKQELMQIGEMRPGSLTRQYTKPKEKKGGYYQISYTYQMRSRTEYVRPEFVQQVRKQVAAFKRFRKLVQQWTDLAIAHSKCQIEIAKRTDN